MKGLLLFLGLLCLSFASSSVSFSFSPEHIPTDISPDGSFNCPTCIAAIDSLKLLIQSNKSVDEIEDIVRDVCIDFKLPDYRNYQEVCAGVVKEFGPEVVEILLMKFVDSKRICQDLKYCPRSDSEGIQDKISYVDRSHLQKQKQNDISWQKAKSSESSKYFFQITDIHVDFDYKVGSVIDCGLPLCCRDGIGGTPDNTTGLFGSYQDCDIPTTVVEYFLSFMTDISQQLDVEYVFWTGDSTPHDVWEETQDMQLGRLQEMTNMIAAASPNVAVYPCFGNHDTFPVDQFADTPQNKWLMSNVTAMWKQWIPKDSQKTMLKGGYYDALIENGLRLISMNTMYCDSNNFWLWLDVDDPTGQLAWMQSVLAQAQSNGEKVWIIGHIPPGDGGCHSDYWQVYYNMISQYNETIVGQFFGHTHRDMFMVFNEQTDDLTPIGAAFVAPSMTTYGGINPSIRLFEYDSDSKQLLDFTQYFFNLTQANQDGHIVIEKEYSMRETYGIADLSPASMKSLIAKLDSNDALFQQFYQQITALAPVNPSVCEGDCKANIICELANVLPSQQEMCMQSA
eukprot:TRINITY_DN2926_c0_g1_i2.p1 TRINITY_DN2926_c0_g1~~TRINITY_DN2926_c0_g1_i2.p1  ORF type:complete len:566 (+),score=196.98 TRINITY_DN2926_c0_g1_i2:28-1725(+)